MAEGKSGVRGKLTWVEGEGEGGGGGDRFARHALYHEDSFREHRYFHPDQPRFFFHRLSQISHWENFSPRIPPPPRYIRNDGKWWKIGDRYVDEPGGIGNGRSVFRMIVGTVQLARAFQFREEERRILFRG